MNYFTITIIKGSSQYIIRGDSVYNIGFISGLITGI